MELVSVQTERPVLPPNKAVKVGGEAPTHEESQGKDVDIPSAMEEVDDEEDIVETQDDSPSLPNLDSCRIEVEEPEQEPRPSNTKV